MGIEKSLVLKELNVQLQAIPAIKAFIQQEIQF